MASAIVFSSLINGEVMSLQERLSTELKAAMKARDEFRLSTIRMIRSAVKNREIDQKRELDDQGIIEIVGTLVKQRRESIRLFAEAGRTDLVEKEEQELATLLEFLPRQLTREEVAALVDEAIATSAAKGPADMGRVMKVVMPLVAGRAEGSVVNNLVREKLAG